MLSECLQSYAIMLSAEWKPLSQMSFSATSSHGRHRCLHAKTKTSKTKLLIEHQYSLSTSSELKQTPKFNCQGLVAHKPSSASIYRMCLWLDTLYHSRVMRSYTDEVTGRDGFLDSPVSLWVLWCRPAQQLQEGPDEYKQTWMKGRTKGDIKQRFTLTEHRAPWLLTPGGRQSDLRNTL